MENKLITQNQLSLLLKAVKSLLSDLFLGADDAINVIVDTGLLGNGVPAADVDDTIFVGKDDVIFII